MTDKQENRICPYCGTVFTTYKTRRRISCGKIECSRRAYSDSGKRGHAKARNAGTYRSPPKTAEVRAKIAASVRRAYAEGRLISSSTRPEVRAKLSAAMLSRTNPMKDPAIRKKVSTTLRLMFRTGKLTAPPMTPERQQKLLESLHRPRTESHRQHVSSGLQRAYKEGRFPWKYRDTRSKAEPVLKPLLEAIGFEHNKRVGVGIPDFVHRPLRIIVEVDGPNHRDTVRIREADARKEHAWYSIGYRVLRVTNDEVIKSPQTILQKVAALMS